MAEVRSANNTCLCGYGDGDKNDGGHGDADGAEVHMHRHSRYGHIAYKGTSEYSSRQTFEVSKSFEIEEDEVITAPHQSDASSDGLVHVRVYACTYTCTHTYAHYKQYA